jgi:uncharacterized protein (DUF4415 family)
MATVKSAKSRRAALKANITPSSSRAAATRSISSLLGELDDRPDTDMRSVSVEELREMARRGELYPTRPGTGEEEVELDESFWVHARAMPPLFPPARSAPAKASVHLRIDSEVFDWFKRQGKGHLTRMNAVLRAYYEANRKKVS